MSGPRSFKAAPAYHCYHSVGGNQERILKGLVGKRMEEKEEKTDILLIKSEKDLMSFLILQVV